MYKTKTLSRAIQLATLALAFAPCPLWAADPAQEIKVLRAQVKMQKATIGHQALMINAMKLEIKRQRKEIAAMKQQLEALKKTPTSQPATKPKDPTPPVKTRFFSGNLKVGDVGRFPYNAKIIQITGPKDMLVSIIPTDTSKRMQIWISGGKTEGLVDDQRIKLIGAYKIIGTKSYTTVGGARATVFLVKPLEKRSVKPAPPEHPKPRGVRAVERRR